MAVFKIDPANSVTTDAPNTPAFNGDSTGADTLIVKAGAHLTALGANSSAAVLANTLGWKATINGDVTSVSSAGLRLQAGNPKKSAITVGADGEVRSSNSSGIQSESAVSIKNSGLVAGLTGIVATDDVVITNAASGTIQSTTIGISLLGGGSHTIKNAGVIAGSFAIMDNGFGNDKIANSGTLMGRVFLGDGTNSLTNKGTIKGDVTGGNGIDKVTNNGTITGLISLNGGNDILKGGRWGETVLDGGGSDTYKLGGGRDVYLAVHSSGDDGTDIVNGGAGFDTYDASNATSNLRINLDRVDHDLRPLVAPPGAGLVAKNTATGSDVDGGAGTKDTIRNFENAKGGAGNDIIYGSAATNVLQGNDGSDILFGLGGNDTLIGGAGLDTLYGGAGKDLLDGGLDGDADFFVFASIKDSRPGKGQRDFIFNFEDGLDRINLSLIDARPKTAGDDAFTYLNGNSITTPDAAFSANGIGGELRSLWTETGYLIEADVNGNGKADFAIELVDPTHSIVLTSADFLL